MKTRTQQIEELQKEWTQPRWEGITRPYRAEDVVKLRGSVNPESVSYTHLDVYKRQVCVLVEASGKARDTG